MPVISKNGRGTAFDANVFRKLISLCDTNRASDVESAIHRAVELCARGQIPFGQAVVEAFGTRDDRVAELEADRENMRAIMAETLGEAENALKQIRDENIRLRQEVGKPQVGQPREVLQGPCRPCERKRRVMALASGGLIALGWFRWLPWNGMGLRGFGYCTGLAIAPIAVVICHWRWLMFKQATSWISWWDNDFFRSIAKRWNRFLERLRMR
jgi:hypothetical protein